MNMPTELRIAVHMLKHTLHSTHFASQVPPHQGPFRLDTALRDCRNPKSGHWSKQSCSLESAKFSKRCSRPRASDIAPCGCARVHIGTGVNPAWWLEYHAAAELSSGQDELARLGTVFGLLYRRGMCHSHPPCNRRSVTESQYRWNLGILDIKFVAVIEDSDRFARL